MQGQTQVKNIDSSIEYINQPNPFESVRMEIDNLKNELNLRKDQLNLPDFDKRKREGIWEQSIQYFRKQIKENFGGQAVTRAWLKMREMLELPEISSRLTYVSAFFNAELPGGFVMATYHYAKANQIPFDWVMSSYLPREDDSANFLPDMFGLMATYPGQSLAGYLQTTHGQVYSNGDLTNPAMPKILATLAKSKLERINLYTADGGFGVEGQENIQEELSIPLIFGEIETGLRCLSPGGVMIIKFFTFFTVEMLTALSHLISLFDDHKLYKPETSNPLNSEIYFIGLGYRVASERIIDIFNNALKNANQSNQSLISEVSPKIREELINKLRVQTRKQISAIDKFVAGEDLDISGLGEVFQNLKPIKNSDKMKLGSS